MPKDKKQEAGITIQITSAANGFTVTGCPAGNHPMGEDVSYVYPTLDKVVKELPAIYSVLSETSDTQPKDERELKEEEYKANEEAGKEKK